MPEQRQYKGFTPLPLPQIASGIEQFREHQVEDGHLYSGHPDMVLASVYNKKHGMQTWLDAPLQAFLQKTHQLDFHLHDAMPIDHGLVRQGACNLKHIDTGGGRVSLVPTREVIGPIGSALEEAGFNIVELGDDQTALGAGIKCRSLDLTWSNQ